MSGDIFADFWTWWQSTEHFRSVLADTVSVSMFGLVGVWMAIEARMNMKARNREIEQSWHAHKKDDDESAH